MAITSLSLWATLAVASLPSKTVVGRFISCYSIFLEFCKILFWFWRWLSNGIKCERYQIRVTITPNNKFSLYSLKQIVINGIKNTCTLSHFICLICIIP